MAAVVVCVQKRKKRLLFAALGGICLKYSRYFRVVGSG